MPLGHWLRSLGRSASKPSNGQCANASAMTAIDQQAPAGAAAADSFRLTFLGKQAMLRPTNTGFGSVQKPLRDVYMASVAASGAEAADKLSERTVQFDGHDMQIRFWEPGARRFQQEVWPLDCVTYLDLVLFNTVKGKKRLFGFFRRHSDSAEVAPDSALIPLHRREAKALAKTRQRPMLCFLVRRPHGIQFLECHVYQIDSERDGLAFIAAFDRHSRAKLQDEKRRDVFNYAPWQPGSNSGAGDSPGGTVNRWSSQPVLAKLATSGTQQQQQQQQQRRQLAATSSSNMATPAADDRQRMSQSSSNVAAVQPVSLMPSVDGGFAVVSQQQPAVAASAMRRTASGTIFDKYKELQAFNIPEYEYMGFQEMQQQVEVLRQQRLQQQAQPRPAEPAPRGRQHLQHHQSLRDQPPAATAAAGSSSKFPSESNIHQRVQQQVASSSASSPRHPGNCQQPQLPPQAPAVAPRRLKAPPAEHYRPSTILEDPEVAAAGRHSQLPAGDVSDPAAAAPPSSVASLVDRFERRVDTHASATPPASGRPVARVPPTPVRHPGADVETAKPAAAEQHRIHRPAPGRSAKDQLHGVSTPDFVAAGLGYLP